MLETRNHSMFIFAKERYLSLMEYVPKKYFKHGSVESWHLLGASGLDSVIYAYDSLLMAIIPDEKFKIDKNKIIFNPETFLFFSALHIGDNDSTGAIAGFWYGVLNGFTGYDINKIKELEFYKDLKKLSNSVILSLLSKKK